MPQCGTCHGWGTVQLGGVTTTCTNPDCRAGVVYDTPVDNGPFTPPDTEDLLYMLFLVALMIGGAYIILK